jgi:hypothetical protein
VSDELLVHCLTMLTPWPDSQWAVVRLFDPLEVVHDMRDRVVQRFSSEDTRIRTILLANVMKDFAQHLVIDNKSARILTTLGLDVQRVSSYFTAKLSKSVVDVDRQHAISVLDSAFEVRVLNLGCITRSATMPLQKSLRFLGSDSTRKFPL